MSTTTGPIQFAEQFQSVRKFTDRLTDSLSPEDCMIQSMEDASPVRWHLAHTTWFFETFVLGQIPGYRVFDEQFSYLFNSYYNSVGDQFPRPHRGIISRPGLSEIKSYRRYVDEKLLEHLESESFTEQFSKVVELGIHHEQQHQELILTDIKHALSANPTLPKFEEKPFADTAKVSNQWIDIEPQLYDVGHLGSGFGFDNEFPRHPVYLSGTQVSRDLVTCGQFIDFIEDGGYLKPEHWLSMGWSEVQNSNWNAPLYWVKRDDQWFQFTLSGLVPVNPAWPVCHISYFEADAYARWHGDRLPTEFEWEVASTLAQGTDNELDGQFADTLLAADCSLHPTMAGTSMLGGVWQWTASSYEAYPGFQAAKGALGEYNGKFMCNQYVLRGGSVATSSSHIRKSYRNFFPASMRWQFGGIRLAKRLPN